MRYLRKTILSSDEYRSIFFQSLGKYFQIILVELGLKSLAFYETDTSKPFILPADCCWTTLGEVIEFSSNLNIQAKFSPDTKINYVDIDAIDNKEYQVREIKVRTVSELSSRARRVLKKGYIVYSLVRPYLNNLALIKDDKENYIGSTGFAVFKGTTLENEFLKLILLSEYVRQRFLEMLSGFNSPTVTQEQFVQTPVPLVPKNLQLGIVEFLADLERDEIKEHYIYFEKEVEEKIITLHDAQLIGSNLLNEIAIQEKKLQLLRQTILQEAVQGKLTQQDPTDEPAIALLQRIKAEKEKLVKAGKLKKEKELPAITEDEFPFVLPEGWVWCRMGEICQRVSVGHVGDTSDYYCEENEGVMFLRSQNVRPGKIDLKGIKYITKDFHQKLKKSTLQEKDLLIVRVGANRGDACLVHRGLPNLNCANIVFARPLMETQEFLLNYFMSPIWKEFGISTTVGSAQGVINTAIVESSIVPLPPLAEQQHIVAKVQQLQQQLSGLEAQVQQSREYAQQLLQSVLREGFETNKRFEVLDKGVILI